MSVDQDSPRVRVPPPLIYLIALLAGIAIDELLRLRIGLSRVSGFGMIDEIRLALTAVPLVAGAGLMLWAAGLFRRAGTNVKPWRTSTALVTDGPFRWSRNPMYLGMTLVYVGLALGFDSPAAILLLVVVLIVMNAQVIAREERYLEGKFGDDYRAYCRRVRRWL